MKEKFERLRVLYNVTRFDTKPNRLGTKERITKSLVATKIGEIEIPYWRDLAKETIVQAGEEKIFNALLDWTSENCTWLKTEKEKEQYALELHMMRIFEDPMWAGYKKFNREYGIEVKTV